MEQSADWLYTKEDAHIYDKAKTTEQSADCSGAIRGRAIRGLLWNNPRIGCVQKRMRTSMTEAETTGQSADCSGAIRGSLQGRGSWWGTPHGSEVVSQERGKCVCLCFLNILHVRQRSVRQADVPLYFPCLLVKKKIAKFISLSPFSFPFSSLGRTPSHSKRKPPPTLREDPFSL